LVDRPRRADQVLIVLFLLAITLPFLGLILRLDNTPKLEENRTLASFPQLSLQYAALTEFPAKFESYFNDQFGFRQRLVEWLNYVKVAGFRVSPSPSVILGKNGWLFYGDIDLPYYRALKPLSEKQLEDWQRVFENRRDWLHARGIPYLIVFAPNKSTVYPEYMPAAYGRVHAQSRLDQLLSHLSLHSNLNVIDLRNPLFAAKASAQIYYRTDSHWNQRGAYVGYVNIMGALKEWFPQLEPVPRSDLREVSYAEPGRDLALLLGLRPYFSDQYMDLETPRPKLARQVPQSVEIASAPRKQWTRGADEVFENPLENLPRAVVFRDSFATWLIPRLADHFRRVTFSWQYTLDRRLVEQEQPDIVIQQMVERLLMAEPDWYLTR
jgi:hypothetical protein